jgi:hypothetical protein
MDGDTSNATALVKVALGLLGAAVAAGAAPAGVETIRPATSRPATSNPIGLVWNRDAIVGSFASRGGALGLVRPGGARQRPRSRG